MIISKVCPTTGKNIVNTNPNASIFKGEHAKRFKPDTFDTFKMSAEEMEGVVAQAKASHSKAPYLEAMSGAHNEYHRKNKVPATAHKPAVIHRSSTAKPAPHPAKSSFKPTAQPRITKQDFDNLTPAEKTRFAREGGRLVANPAQANNDFQSNTRHKMSREAFNKLTPAARTRFSKEGGKLTN